MAQLQDLVNNDIHEQLDDHLQRLRLNAVNSRVLIIVVLIVLSCAVIGCIRVFFDGGITFNHDVLQASNVVVENPKIENVVPEPDESPQVHEEKLFVHVSGAVVSPGVYQLDCDARVIDAIDAAGGILEQGTVDDLNLAMPIIDGSKVVVHTQDELQTSEIQETNDYIQFESTDVVSRASDVININTAGIDELITLPGIGETTAQSIIQYRDEYGPFTSIEDLTNVSGIGPKKLERIYGLVHV